MSAPEAGPAQGELRLSVPAEVAYAATVRVFAGAVARAAGLDEERVDDLKLILSELCANASEGPGGPGLEIVARPGVGSIEAVCRGAGDPPAGHGGDVEDHRARLLAALAPDLAWDADGTVRFSLPG